MYYEVFMSRSVRQIVIAPAFVAFWSLAGCTGSTADTSVPVDSPSDSVDSADTAPDVVPVWNDSHIETSSTFHGVYASGEGTYIVGTEGKAFAGTAAVGFTDLVAPVDVDLRDLWGSGSSQTLSLVAVGQEGHILHYAAGAWTDEDLGTNNFEGVGGSGPNAIYAVGWGGIYESVGAEWNFVTAPDGVRLNDVWGLGGDAVAVGEDGDAAVRTGGQWASTSTAVTTSLHAVSGVAANDVWAVGESGTVLHWDGAAWTLVTVPTTQSLWAVWAATANDVFVVGNNGTALYFDGTVWKDLPTGVVNNLYAVHGSSPTNVWAVGNRGAAIQYKP